MHLQSDVVQSDSSYIRTNQLRGLKARSILPHNTPPPTCFYLKIKAEKKKYECLTSVIPFGPKAICMRTVQGSEAQLGQMLSIFHLQI